LAVGAVWRGCGRHEARIETTIHFKLKPGMSEMAALADVDVLADSALFESDEPELRPWHSARVRGSRKEIDATLERLNAFEPPTLELPVMLDPVAEAEADGDSCPIKTPSYEKHQGYLGPAPGGINAMAAWRERGGRGDAVWFADIEGAWNAKHEDLPGDRLKALGKEMDDRGWEMHGTAVLGEVVSRDNRIGMLGIAPNVARVFTSSVVDRSAAKAIDRAQAALRPGDVLLIELHAIGPRRRFMPMEFWDDVFDVIKVATKRGVIVIEAAGNGAENLDHEAYKGKLDRRQRDSGAIMVGAGAPAVKDWTDRSRLDFSNYGSRVDIQGWGRMVATADYGDLQGCDATNRKYTKTFGGTSSASPIVAGAALILESVVKTSKGCVLSPARVRSILAETGSPQTDGPHGPASQNIGPRPDVVRAIEKARSLPGCD
jgi:subtilisin family serine protease